MRRERPVRAVRRGLTATLGAVVFSGTFVVACGDDEPPKTPEELYAGQYASSTCAVMEPCCRANGLTFDPGNCTLGGAGYVQVGVDANLKAGAKLDPKIADECIKASVAATKQCTVVADDPDAHVLCARAWSGPKKSGEACNGDNECESTEQGPGVCLKTSGPDNPGVCVIRTSNAQIGDVCGKTPDGQIPTTIADCDGAGLQCNILSGTCSALVAIGEKCGSFNRCVKGAFCNGSATCVAGLEAGATCSVNQPAECASGVCIRGKCAQNGVGGLTPCTGEKQ